MTSDRMRVCLWIDRMSVWEDVMMWSTLILWRPRLILTKMRIHFSITREFTEMREKMREKMRESERVREEWEWVSSSVPPKDIPNPEEVSERDPKNPLKQMHEKFLYLSLSLSLSLCLSLSLSFTCGVWASTPRGTAWSPPSPPPQTAPKTHNHNRTHPHTHTQRERESSSSPEEASTWPACRTLQRFGVKIQRLKSRTLTWYSNHIIRRQYS